jgi:hypothetical protein
LINSPSVTVHSAGRKDVYLSSGPRELYVTKALIQQAGARSV